jgi:hypothetical protein
MYCTDPDCGHLLGEADLAAGCCQNCYDMLDATQVEVLRKEMGIATYAPPEITIPEKNEETIALPEFEMCPGCSADLMDQSLSEWRQGAPCPFCQEPSPHLNATASSQGTLDVEKLVDTDMLPFILNSGPNIGTLFFLPIGVDLGRNDLRQVLAMPGYESKRGYLSGEHFKVHFSKESGIVSIEDLGSKNGTYINGVKIVGPIPKKIDYGDVLNLHDLSFCLGAQASPFLRVTHRPSGVVTEHPIVDALLRLHLGRVTLEGGREPWFRMAQIELNQNQDALDALETISRRHLFLELEQNEDQISISIWNEEHKAAFDVQGVENLAATSTTKFVQPIEPSEHKSIIFTHGENVFEVEYLPIRTQS